LLNPLMAVPQDEPRANSTTPNLLGEGFDAARLGSLFLALLVYWRGTLQHCDAVSTSNRPAED
jgi:hypothetical protein